MFKKRMKKKTTKKQVYTNESKSSLVHAVCFKKSTLKRNRCSTCWILYRFVDFILVHKWLAVKHFCALDLGFILKSCYVIWILDYENKTTLDDYNVFCVCLFLLTCVIQRGAQVQDHTQTERRHEHTCQQRTVNLILQQTPWNKQQHNY